MDVQRVIWFHDTYVKTGRWVIYSDGRIFSHNSNRFIGGTNGNGYVLLSTRRRKEPGKKTCLGHLLVFYHFHGYLEPTKVINHIDGNKKNNSIDNLELVTEGENIAHARETGLLDHAAACEKGASMLRKLTEEDVRYIRSSDKTGIAIAKEFGLSKSTVSLVRNSKTYQWVL